MTYGRMPKTEYHKFIRLKRMDRSPWKNMLKPSRRIFTKLSNSRKNLTSMFLSMMPEFYRIDMVEYFGEQFSGFAFTANGWVQSYGSRCVKLPIIYGDVSRPKAMTVFWSSMAQEITKRSMKGMLTCPVTILNWSFVGNGQPRFETCYEIALVIKDEVEDHEKARIAVIQIDEAALREGLPLRKKMSQDE